MFRKIFSYQRKLEKAYHVTIKYFLQIPAIVFVSDFVNTGQTVASVIDSLNADFVALQKGLCIHVFL